MKRNLRNLKDQKGITLIALVVTIVVLLILAGITINLLLDDGGIINKANQSKNAMEDAKDNELAALNDVANKIDELTNTSSGTNPAGNNEITFTIDGTQYRAEAGMTWSQWLTEDKYHERRISCWPLFL